MAGLQTHTQNWQAGLLAVLAFTTWPLHAQLPVARLDGIFPPGLRAGSEQVVRLTGVDLDQADRLIFSDAGLSAVPVEGLDFKITASAGMSAGLYEVRVAGRYGISASRLFAVGMLPEIREEQGNVSSSTAQKIMPPVTVNGTAGADAADHFQFPAAAGQRLIISCAAQRIDSPLNAVVKVLDAAGAELATAHRTNGQDAVIDFTAPHDGIFLIRLHDMAWAAGASAVYRLTIAVPGEPAGEGEMAVPLAGSLLERLPDGPVVELLDPGKSALMASEVSVPSVIATPPVNGMWLEFSTQQDRQVMVDVISHRQGQPSDWMLQVFKVAPDAEGKEAGEAKGIPVPKMELLAEFDDSPAPSGAEGLLLESRDPSGSIACVAGTKYRLHLVDRFRSGGSPKVFLRDPVPGFSLVSFPVSPANGGPSLQRWSSLLRKGGSALVQVAVIRHDGFADEVTVRMEDLPVGVTASEVTVPSGSGLASMVLQALPEAESGNGRIRITGSSGSLTSIAREAVPRWSVADRGSERAEMRLSRDGQVLSVYADETAPLTLAAEEDRIYEMAPGGSLEIPVRFVRDASLKGFKGEWEAVLMGMPGLRQAPVVKPPADATGAKLVLDLKRQNGNQFLPGLYHVHASARGTIQWQPDESVPVRELLEAAWSPPIRIRITESPAVLAAPGPVAVTASGSAEVMLTVERRYGFKEAVAVELEPTSGMNWLSASPLSITAESSQAAWVIAAAGNPPHGKYRVRLRAKCTWNGEEIVWHVPMELEVKP